MNTNRITPGQEEAQIASAYIEQARALPIHGEEGDQPRQEATGERVEADDEQQDFRQLAICHDHPHYTHRYAGPPPTEEPAHGLPASV